ncbi:aspartate/glutamate/uridylate kinase [Rippkaea orientalis PCC 8801]|uniref:Aspartate/glutamate/uridylate kinase n=1 Tax=Rippkaea orientalis (strain PCC 8801 / RF-1) TaxID=41431 RepID=B7K3C5_RIPO1|nr:uridylate kinase [Rippkaea orientalis]ACK64445.1 aspartate/glutamate/uridylate kinase [Rippkaea orientalis PCC 8801]
MTETVSNNDLRHHLNSMLMRESLLDKEVQKSTEVPVIRMLPDTYVVKIGGRSILDKGRVATHPVVEVLGTLLGSKKLIIGTGGGARTRHVFSIGIDLGMPSGVLAELAQADALGNAHILGALLAPYGVVAIPPEVFGHLLPLFIRSVPGVIFTGVPPYSLWEHPPEIGRIPPHGSDAGSFLLAECFGCQSVTLVKDVKGLYDRDPNLHADANFIPEISTTELRKGNFETLPFERILLNLLDHSRLIHQVQIVNGLEPETIIAAVNGEHAGTIIHRDN